MTIEDPVEYVFPSINQIQINEQADITFAGGLRSILRQDPDVILVGEIRDVETARIAVQSALTGHFVLSSLHATDATAALHRFLDMGIESFLVASSVLGVVAQRLVRRICSRAGSRTSPAPTSWRSTRSGAASRRRFFHGAGLQLLRRHGLRRPRRRLRAAAVTPTIEALIVDSVARRAPAAARIDEGMRTLRDEALRLIEEDVTTIAEVLRSIYIA